MRERTGNSAVRYDSKPSPRFFLNGPLPGLSFSVSLCDSSLVTMGILFYFIFYGFPVPLETSHGMHHWIWFALQLMTDPSKSTGFCGTGD